MVDCQTLKQEQTRLINRVIEIETLLVGAKFHGSVTIQCANGKPMKKETKAVEDIRQ